MLLPIISLLIGIVLLYFGAEGLVRGGASIAARLGLTPLVIGLTIVSFGTSMPEMVVSVGASLSGIGPIAVGNVIGSNIANIALILGVAALIFPPTVHAKIIRIDLPILVAVSLVMVGLLWNDVLSRIEGSLLLFGLLAYTAFSLRAARRETREVVAEYAESIPSSSASLIRDVAFVLGGLTLLVLGSRSLVSGAVTIAETFGMSQVVIGLTIVAIGTSLPELATSVLAAIRGESDIAVGNVVGSNLFNILGILGASAVANPLAESGVSPIDLGLAVLLTLILLPLMRSGFRVSRLEGGVLVAVYVTYVWYLLP